MSREQVQRSGHEANVSAPAITFGSMARDDSDLGQLGEVVGEQVGTDAELMLHRCGRRVAELQQIDDAQAGGLGER